MLSRNNYQEKLRKMEPKKERFSIRKFTVGAASVLIGFTIFGLNNGQTVKADTTTGDTAAKDADPNATTKDPSADLKLTAAATKAADQVQPATDQTKDASQPAAKQADPKASATDQTKAQTSAADSKQQDVTIPTPKTATTDTTKVGPQADTEKADTTTVDSKTDPKASSAKPTNLAAKPQAKAATNSVDPATLRGTQSKDAATWQDLVKYLNDASVGTINITSNITVANNGTTVNGITRPNPVVNGGKMTLNGTNISGGLIINGNGNTIDFGANYLAFTTNNQKTSTPWDIEFENLTINATGYDEKWSTLGGSFSPIYMGSDDIDTNLLAKNKVTFNGVTADVKNGAFYSTNMTSSSSDKPYTTVVFAGKNNITVEKVNVNGNQLYNYASAIDASRVIFANGTDTIINVSSAKTNNDLNAGANIIRAKVEDPTDTQPPVIVEQDANVTLNGKSNDVRGIMANNALVGTVQVDGNLTENMAAGHSTAILAGNLNIGKTGNLTINTQQDNNKNSNTTNANENFDGFHYAPISLGTGISSSGSTNADSTTLDDQGKLIINRTGDPSTITPLIAFGSASSALIKGQFTLNVDNGATLDLQDDAVYSTTKAEKFPGLVSMYGSGASGSGTFNHVNITNPAYVNFQRTGSQAGQLMRLENMNNQVNIIGNGANVPLAEWSEGNTTPAASFLWYITQLQNQNNWGDSSITGFTPKNNSIGQSGAGVTFLNSNGSVTLGSNQAGKNGYNFTDGVVAQGDPAQGAGVDYETPYLNQLLNQFSWAKSQRISIGSKAQDNPTNTDANKYDPIAEPIDGNTSQKLSDLPLTNTDHTQGLTGLYDPDQKKEVDLSNVDLTKSHWYDSTTDAATWNKQMLGADNKTPMPVPTNPTGNLKTTDKSAWATVVYKDGSVDFVNIPLNITAPLDKDLFQPSYTGQTMKPSDSKDVPVAYTPSTDGKINVGGKAPEDTKYTVDNTGLPAGMTATVADDGTVTITTVNTPEGAVNIPVTVTYPDGTTDKPDSETVYVPVYVTDNKGDETVTWGDNGAVVTKVDTSKLNAHETSDNSQVLNAASAVTVNGYALGSDGKISTTATPITVDPSKVTWSTTPDTTVPTATAAGKQIANESIKVDLSGNTDAQNILGSKNGVVTTDPFTIDAKGAGAKNVTTPVDVTVGSDLTDDQFKALVDNNIPTDEIASTTWGTKPDKDGNGGVIKITFNDKDKDGNPTYLNINIPASSLNMVPADAAQYDVTYKPQIVKGGDSVTVDPVVTKGTDKTPSTVPDGTKYSFDNGKQTTTIDGVTVNIDQTTGKITFTAPTDSSATMNIPVKVTYPDNTADKPSVDDTTATVYVVNGYPKDNPAQNPQNAGDAIKGKDNLPGNTTETYDPNKTPDPNKDGNQDTNVTVTIPGVGSVTVPSTVTYPDQKTPTYPDNTKVKQGDTATITPTIPEGEKPTFKPGDTSNLPGGMGVTVDPNTGVITVTTTDNTPTGKVNIPVVVTQNGKDTTVNVPVEVDPATPQVTYPQNNPVQQGGSTVITPTIPEGEKPTFKPGDTSNLPGGMGVTVDPNTGDITVTTKDDTPTGDTKIPVVVDPGNGDPTYTVNVPVTVTKPGDTTTDVAPVTKPNEVSQGATSIPAENGIANMPGSGAKDELPSGTTVTWDKTDPKTGMPIDPVTGNPIDTSKPGIYDNVPATVTYPDKSTAKVNETVVVGDIVDITNNPGHNDLNNPNQDVPGYERDKFDAVNGKFGDGSTEKIYLIKDGTSSADVIKALNPTPDAGYVGGTWNPLLPNTFTKDNAADKSFTITFTKENLDNGNGGEGTTPTTPGNGTPSTGDNGNDNNQTPSDNNGQNGNTDNTGNGGQSTGTKHNSGKKNNTEENTNPRAEGNNSGSTSGMNAPVHSATTSGMNNGSGMNGNGMNGNNNGMNANSNAKKLPQTGESKTNAGIFGLAIASLAGLFGLAGSRKRHEDK